jgi:uncharacterized protein YjbI with pentapeptide repeats
LTGGAIGDLDVEVKWGYPCEAFWPGRDGCILEVEVMTAEELLERYAAGERSFSGIRLYAEEYARLLNERNLSGVNLCGSTLEGDWSGVNLSNARLRGIVANGCDIQRANFSQANLSGASFIECDMSGCNFNNAILGGVRFNQTVVCESNFTGSYLRGAYLDEADLDRINLSNADLRGADGCDIDILQYFGCVIHNTQMPDGSIYSQ